MAFRKFNKIVSLVIWYKPRAKEVEAVKLYNKDVEQVIIVDNSDTDNGALCAEIANVTYIPLMENKGIAAALNRGCEEAKHLGAEWVLTMDQDSRWDQHSVRQYIEEAEKYEGLDEVGIFSPFHDCDGTPERHHRKGRYELREVVMCSGNLLRLSAWQQTGGFREDFFIDLVDDEMCCHLYRLGWIVVRLNSIMLTHKLGNGVQFLGPTRHRYTPHPAWRYYYIGRNLIRIAKLYPEKAKYYRNHALKELKRLLLYDWNEDKHDKLCHYIRGLREGMHQFPPSCN